VETFGVINKAPTHMLADELKVNRDIPFIINRHRIQKLRYKFCAPVLKPDGHHEFVIRIRIKYIRQASALETGEDTKLKTKTQKKLVITIRAKKRELTYEEFLDYNMWSVDALYLRWYRVEKPPTLKIRPTLVDVQVNNKQM